MEHAEEKSKSDLPSRLTLHFIWSELERIKERLTILERYKEDTVGRTSFSPVSSPEPAPQRAFFFSIFQPGHGVLASKVVLVLLLSSWSWYGAGFPSLAINLAVIFLASLVLLGLGVYFNRTEMITLSLISLFSLPAAGQWFLTHPISTLWYLLLVNLTLALRLRRVASQIFIVQLTGSAWLFWLILDQHYQPMYFSLAIVFLSLLYLQFSAVLWLSLLVWQRRFTPLDWLLAIMSSSAYFVMSYYLLLTSDPTRVGWFFFFWSLVYLFLAILPFRIHRLLEGEVLLPASLFVVLSLVSAYHLLSWWQFILFVFLIIFLSRLLLGQGPAAAG